jgi:hypothetical protein
MGQIVAIVAEAKTEKAITDAKIEILTLQNALITTVTPNYFGKARQSLEEGPYRIRVSHPRYAAEVRQVHVVKGQTAEVHLRLRGGSSSPLDQAERVVREGVGLSQADLSISPMAATSVAAMTHRTVPPVFASSDILVTDDDGTGWRTPHSRYPLPPLEEVRDHPGWPPPNP